MPIASAGDFACISRRTLLACAGLTALMPQAVRARQSGAAGVAAHFAGKHPSAYYQEAANLFRIGRQDEAVFLFYLGQLRYRTHLRARPNLPQGGDPALFASLSESIGRPINEYAFGDISALERTIAQVLAFDLAFPDTFTSPTEFPDALRANREGMETLRRRIIAEADRIREGRRANGLPNRN
ncbi:MAG: hypothetical protein JNK84_20910 [Phreatobacter sp.]|uniref:hypothetical protein n=1 Tax=Phreatobacter sp. TaxID=1966341 RepID=UPI001A3669FA|nr:hypothetical protein [Phreatobacter sp.]MBL8571545.1 hypothetical protein [Phreatobacter sp.]